MLKRFAVATMIAASLGVLALAPAMAKGNKGGRSGGSASGDPSLAINQSGPRFGDTVTFAAAYAPMSEVARVRVFCYQNSVWVYQDAQPADSGFTLAGGLWTGGGADCTADLFYFTYRGQTQTGVVYLANTQFSVAG
jgi:hypothetical protein